MAQWLSIVVSPLVFLTNLSIAYALVPLACQMQRTAPIHVTNAIALMLVLVAAALAWLELRSTASVDRTSAEASSRSRFLAVVGVWVSAIAALAIVLQWATQWALAPCIA